MEVVPVALHLQYHLPCLLLFFYTYKPHPTAFHFSGTSRSKYKGRASRKLVQDETFNPTVFGGIIISLRRGCLWGEEKKGCIKLRGNWTEKMSGYGTVGCGCGEKKNFAFVFCRRSWGMKGEFSLQGGFLCLLRPTTLGEISANTRSESRSFLFPSQRRFSQIPEMNDCAEGMSQDSRADLCTKPHTTHTL